MFLSTPRASTGFILVGHRTYCIVAHLPHFPSIRNLTLRLDPRLSGVLEANDLVTCLSKDPSFEDLLKSIKEIVEEKLLQNDIAPISPSWGLSSKASIPLLLREVSELQNVIEVVERNNSKHCQFTIIDELGKEHKIVVAIPCDYPNGNIHVIEHDFPLPEGTEVSHFDSLKTLKSCHKKICEVISWFEEFWKAIYVLDNNSWVVEPEVPNCKDVHRKIRVTDDVVMVLVFNPFNMLALPSITFLGNANSVAKFQFTLGKNLQLSLWDSETDILSNLMTVLDLQEFPKQSSQVESTLGIGADAEECNICYQFRSEGEIPTIFCDCQMQFHAGCLFQYFKMYPDSKMHFGRIQGTCPGCNKILACPAPQNVT